VNMVLGIKQLYKGNITVCEFEVLAELLLGCDTESTGKQLDVSEEIAALYSVYRRLTSTPKRR